ncbi:MAG: hypothetical protein QOE61_2345, partial [Micromonosporaceae bacterium]|nr:hypothetical protein [Micromonosporaceae bacterium]
RGVVHRDLTAANATLTYQFNDIFKFFTG